MADDYRELLRTVFRPARQELRDAFDAVLSEHGFLVQDIFLQVLPAYERAPAISELHPEVCKMFGVIAEKTIINQEIWKWLETKAAG
ncbi:MAG: hypothetical protein QXT58_02790 [Archaeoglobaceae archaeon]